MCSNSALVRGLYDLVFGYEDADPERPAVGAGVMVFLIGLVLFEYKGAIFWKMTAGMGDVVIAPLYQALRRRGVDSSSSIGSTRCISTTARQRRRRDHDGPPGATRRRGRTTTSR